MKEEDLYYTIEQTRNILHKVKGSKFWGYAMEVHTEEEIKVILDRLYTQHPKARHHCYAWKLGLDNNHFKAWDDGEPSGTAGKPILGQLEKYGLTNCIIVVVRYFGGTLLGPSGLIKAYKRTAEQVINESSIIQRQVTASINIISDFVVYNKVEQALAHFNLNVINRDLGKEARITVSIPKSTVANTTIHLKAYISESYKEEVTLKSTFEHFRIEIL